MNPDTKPTKPVDIYIRVSRVGGREGVSFQSPEQQEERCRAQLTADGLQAGDVFIDLDESGASTTRPEFRKMMKERMDHLKMDPSFAGRYLNEGFSGGEKKRAEILQMAVLKPEIAILDETDSGLDIDALRIVSEGVNALRGSDLGVLVMALGMASGLFVAEHGELRAGAFPPTWDVGLLPVLAELWAALPAVRHWDSQRGYYLTETGEPFPTELALRLTAVGEQTGQLDAMLDRVGSIYELALQRQLARLTGLLTPVLTLAMGALVGGLLLSVMGAIASVNDLALR